MADRSIGDVLQPEMMKGKLPIDRLPKPEDYAAAFVFLAAAGESAQATGSIINIDGGFAARGVSRRWVAGFSRSANRDASARSYLHDDRFPVRPSGSIAMLAITGASFIMSPKQIKPPTSDAAVLAATGKTWSQWVKALNAAGAAKLNHKEIVARVRAIGSPDTWWPQMVTVGYERLTGRRKEGETPGGHAVSASRTIGVAQETAFKAFVDTKARKRWLAESAIVVHKSTPPRSVRITWTDGTKSVSVNIYAKAAQKCQVSLNHVGLANAAAAKRLQRFWAGRLDALRGLLEGR